MSDLPIVAAGGACKRSSKKSNGSKDQAQKRTESEMNGKFKAGEVALVLTEDCTILKDINKKFDEKLEAGTRLAVHRYPCSINGLYRWTHRSTSFGGCCNIGDSNSEVFPYVVLEISPEAFIAQVKQTNDGSEYNALAGWIGETLHRMKSREHCPLGTRLTILIIGLDRYLAKLPPRSETSSSCRLPLTQMIDNATAFLLLCEHSVEIVSLKTAAEAADYLHGMTPYNFQNSIQDNLFRQ
jgi:hypothetical protein